ncbi:Cas10/Cmr2 second palm domain-containing protein [Pyruvatibacter mobilis]|uniref:Cas10/Cmr2 second palm domain-containing protein n=1 Tax=Pyruvatibacter mobilis TaxID=1712261 RepID=UPI003C7AFF59
MAALYGFEAKSIQPFVLEGGKLADLVAASSLVDSLINAEGTDCVAVTEQALGPHLPKSFEGFNYLRRTGGALFIRCEDGTALRMFRQAWTLGVQQWAPGLPFVDCLLTGDEAALKELMQQLAQARNLPPAAFPPLAPGMMRAARTGRPATAHRGGTGVDPVDEATRTKRHFAVAGLGTSGDLGLRCIPKASRSAVFFPVNFEATANKTERFPFPSDNQVIALVHADGNRLGNNIIRLATELKAAGESIEKVMPVLSRAIAVATQDAVQQAFAAHVVGKGLKVEEAEVVPARPIVVGGDDVTMLLRADIALDWTETFLKAFRQQTRTQVSTLLADATLPAASAELVKRLFGDGLSAGAGIVYASASMPFDQLHHLVEGVASYAKTEAKAAAKDDGVPPSLVSIYRVTASALDDFATVQDRDLTVSGGRILSMNPYLVPDEGDTSVSGIANVADLKGLANLLGAADFPSGPLRQYVGLLSSNAAEARQVWGRFLQMARRKGHQDNLNKMLRPLLGADWSDEPFDSGQRTPLLDAISLNAVMREMSNEQ